MGPYGPIVERESGEMSYGDGWLLWDSPGMMWEVRQVAGDIPALPTGHYAAVIIPMGVARAGSCSGPARRATTIPHSHQTGASSADR